MGLLFPQVMTRSYNQGRKFTIPTTAMPRGRWLCQRPARHLTPRSAAHYEEICHDYWQGRTV